MWILSRWVASGSGLCNLCQDSKITYSLGEGNLAALIADESGGSIEELPAGRKPEQREGWHF